MSGVAEGIRERLLRERDYLVIEKFEDTIDVDVPETGKRITLRKGKAFVFQIQGVARNLKYEPYQLYTQGGVAIPALPPGTGLPYQRLYNSNGEDILRVEDDAWVIYHFSIAVQQPEIRIYPQIPPDIDMGGWEYLTAGQPQPNAGSNFGYVAGREIADYYNPPASLETIGWRGKDRVSSKSYARFGFWNESALKIISPIFNIYGRAYLVHPVMEEEAMRKIVAGPPVGPARTLVFEGPIRAPYSLPVPTDWEIAKNYIPITGATLPQQLLEEGGL